VTVAADSIETLREAVRRGPRVLPVGAGTKPALSTPPSDDVVGLDVVSLQGIVEYDPEELTLTALAGTPVTAVAAALAEHGQYLPFDPPRRGGGATGASGPGAYRHGGVRDFVIGVQFIDGTGRLITGGGKVVKNAAGFDLPKLMVGSIGRLGVIVRLSLKVFPQPPGTATVIFDLGSAVAALPVMASLARGPVALDALDLAPGGRLLVRLGGDPDTLPARAARLASAIDAPAQNLAGEQELALWADAAELSWADGDEWLVRVGLTARTVLALDSALAVVGARAHYSLAANVAWVVWPADRRLDDLDEILRTLQLTGMVLDGPPGRALLGVLRGGAFATRVTTALDPHSRFLKTGP
jgi:glycolate oxidase FAD binding subunit